MKKTLIFAVLSAIIIGVIVFFNANNYNTHITVDYGTDISKKYKDFFEYTFRWYQLELETETVHYRSEGGNYGSRKWYLNYYDKNGNFRSGRIVCSKFTDDEQKHFGTEKAYNDSLVYRFCEKQIEDIACEEFTDNILKNYFESVYFSASDGLSDFDDFYGDQGYELRFFIDIEDLKKLISPTTGIKLSDIDLKDIALSDDIKVYFNMIIDRDENQQEYIKKLDSIFDDYCEYVGDPKNYQFDVALDIDREHKEYECIYSITGENGG